MYTKNNNLLNFTKKGGAFNKEQNQYMYNTEREGSLLFKKPYQYCTYAIGHPSNRKEFKRTSKVIKSAFEYGKKRVEFWRGMYSFRTKSPKSTDPMLGNFYLECDSLDFFDNMVCMAKAVHYLETELGIPKEYMSCFIANKSVWLEVPYKCFGCFGSVRLNEIHSELAREIQSYLASQGWSMKFDLSIYRYNGLMHALGSYLPVATRLEQKDCWVIKQNVDILVDDRVTSKQDFRNFKYDNDKTFEDVEICPKAQEWYINKRNEVLSKVFVQRENQSDQTAKTSCDSDCSHCKQSCVNKLFESGKLELNRNLHLYSCALALKTSGFDVSEATDYIFNNFSNDKYMKLPEAERTVQSAFKHNKYFSCHYIKELFEDEYLDCDNCSYGQGLNKESVSISRETITLINSQKLPFQALQIYLLAAYYKQIECCDYKFSVKGDKHKDRTIKNLDKLVEIGLITYEQDNTDITVKYIRRTLEEFKSHVRIPVSFYKSEYLFTLRNTLTVLFELWRCCIHKGQMLFYNVKIETLSKNLKMCEKTVCKHLAILKALNLVHENRILIHFTKNERVRIIRDRLALIKSRLSKIKKEVLEQKREFKNVTGQNNFRKKDISQLGNKLVYVVQKLLLRRAHKTASLLVSKTSEKKSELNPLATAEL